MNLPPLVFPHTDCRPELYLPFNGDVKDESGNNNYVQNEGVKVVNGAGFFNGNAVLRVPRFANADYGDFVLIRLRYKQDASGGGRGNQALVANGDCLKPSSLYMVTNQQGMTFGAQTMTGKNATVNVPTSVCLVLGVGLFLFVCLFGGGLLLVLLLLP